MCKAFFLPASSPIKIDRVFRNVGNKAFSRREKSLKSDGEYYLVLLCSYQMFLVELLSKFSWPYTTVFRMVISGRYGFIAFYKSKTFLRSYIKTVEGDFSNVFRYQKKRKKKNVVLDFFSIYIFATYASTTIGRSSSIV